MTFWQKLFLGITLGGLHAHRQLHKATCAAENCRAEAMVQSRLRAKCLRRQPVVEAVRLIPSGPPGEHRIANMRCLLNGEMTIGQLRRALGQPVQPCPFCGAAGGGSASHRGVCAVAAEIRRRLPESYDNLTDGQSRLQQGITSGSVLQSVLAWKSAMARVRRLLRDGRGFFGLDDIALHVRRLSDDAWLTVSPEETIRQLRHMLRARPPTFGEGWVVYASDGASRRHGTAD